MPEAPGTECTVPPGGKKNENLKSSYMINTKHRKHHKMCQGMKTIIKVLVKCPLVAIIKKLKLSYQINTKCGKHLRLS
jgi:hypothetical protein